MTEQKVFGRKACLALLNHRPDDVLRLYHAKEVRSELSGILPWMAAKRLAYRELSDEELGKVAGSPHHEGLVLSAQPLMYRSWPPPQEILETPDPLWLALDGVTNPHNLGAMLRTAAFFGINGVLLGGVTAEEKVNAAVLRVAEGGAEWVPLFAVPELAMALTDLHGAGCGIIGLETDGRVALSEVTRTGLIRRGTVLVMGQEQSGLSRAVRQACDALCALEGKGRLESLNVSVAAGVALALLSAPVTPPPASQRLTPQRAGASEAPPREQHTRPEASRSIVGRGAPGKPRGAGTPKQRPSGGKGTSEKGSSGKGSSAKGKNKGKPQFAKQGGKAARPRVKH